MIVQDISRPEEYSVVLVWRDDRLESSIRIQSLTPQLSHLERIDLLRSCCHLIMQLKPTWASAGSDFRRGQEMGELLFLTWDADAAPDAWKDCLSKFADAHGVKLPQGVL